MRARREELGAGAPLDRRGPEADRQLERLAQRRAGVATMPRAAQRGSEVGERTSVLEAGRRGLKPRDRGKQQIDPRGAVLDQTGHAQRGADRSRRTEAVGAPQLLRDEFARTVAITEARGRQRG